MSLRGEVHPKTNRTHIPAFFNRDCHGFISSKSPKQWHDSVSPCIKRHSRKTLKAPSISEHRRLTALRQIPLTRPMPSRSSQAVRTRARSEHRSKLRNRNENIYNSKLSMEKSFDIAETQKTAPRISLGISFSLLKRNCLASHLCLVVRSQKSEGCISLVFHALCNF